MEALLERKKQSQEKEIAPAIKLLNDFIESELEKLEQLSVDENESDRDIDDLNVLFAKLVS
ncbi:MAG: nucleotidyltransferase domain-containing protein [Pseudomonadota bacterium]